MERRALPFEAPEGVLFTLKDLSYSPEQPREKEPFTVKGKIELFKIPFVTPIWVQAKVTYPERWWEEIIPIIGGPTISEGATVFGGNFEINFPKGFDREGEFILEVAAYLGPTFSMDSIVIPPFPPVASEKTTFIVAGEVPPEELGFRNFRILSYTKNGGTPVTPPGVLELDVGDRLQIKLGFDHRDLAVTAKMHAAIWQKTTVDPHDEVLNKEKTFSVLASDDWEPREEGIEIIITSDIAPGTEYGLYAKIMGVTGGDIFTDYLENVITIIGPPELGFDLTRPSVTPAEITPGTPITITCPVTSACTKEQTATAKVKIYEGSIYAGHGTLITTKTSSAFSIAPGQTYNVIINHTAIAGTIDRRDVEVEIYVGGKLVKESEWDDVYYVKAVEEVLAFDLTKPTASPSEVIPGATVTLTCPVTSRCTKSQSVTAKVLIYEGSIYTGHGSLLATKTVNFTISPNQTYNATVTHPTIAGSIDRRDIEVEVYVEGRKIKESEWDDVYYVKAAVEQYTLSVSVEPSGTGWVTKSPTKTKYTEGEYVSLTATPYSGYEFDYWSGDASGYSTPISIYMNSNRSVTAHFKEKLPDVGEIVNFSMKGDGFPFNTRSWIVYYYDPNGVMWTDNIQHDPGDTIWFYSVPTGGYMSCFCEVCPLIGTCAWSEQKYSNIFLAVTNRHYKYDIASGKIFIV